MFHEKIIKRALEWKKGINIIRLYKNKADREERVVKP
jgi:hypothetical protein